MGNRLRNHSSAQPTFHNDAEITEYFASIYGFRVVFAVDNFAN